MILTCKVHSEILQTASPSRQNQTITLRLIFRHFALTFEIQLSFVCLFEVPHKKEVAEEQDCVEKFNSGTYLALQYLV